MAMAAARLHSTHLVYTSCALLIHNVKATGLQEMVMMQTSLGGTGFVFLNF